jgi:iron complex outermembrane receptor protein
MAKLAEGGKLAGLRCGTTVLAAATLLAAFPAAAQVGRSGVQASADIDALDQDLSRLSLEELALIDVTSVSRRPEALAAAAAAIFVINSEDIRRSGAASLPEILRLAPNLNVQRVNAGDYAISARGFNGFETSNKLLVLVDGRSIYSTLASNIFWDGRTIPLEDIDRIEVISGPGGTLYGANAVNGVINIITRSAADTQGGLIQVGAGSEDGTLYLRQGGIWGSGGAWRAYLSAFDRDDSLREISGDATDSTSGIRGGVRLDWAGERDSLTGQAEIFDNQVRTNEDFAGTETRLDGGHVRGLWTRTLGSDGELQVAAYYDRFSLTEPGLTEGTDTTDISAQHAFAWGDRHRLVWGGGYRRVKTALHSAFTTGLVPAERRLSLTNLFVQDQIALSEALTVTLGLKLEENSFTGREFLPSLRLAWQSPTGDLAWGAISRASRTPNRIERDLTLPGFLVGGDFQSEILTAYELGYRTRPTATTSLSISAFYNVYDDLRTVAPDPVAFLPIRFANGGQGESHGIEAWGSWDIDPRWRLSAGLSTLEKDFGVKPGQVDITGLASLGDDPGYQLLLRSQADLADRLELDVRLRAVDDLDRSGLDSYVEADVRVGWRVSSRVELALTGQNLIDERRLETSDPARRRAFGRSIFASLRASF